MNSHIDNAYQRIDMAMGLIPLGKTHALLSEALDELHLAIADRSASAPRRETGVARKGESGGAGTAIAQQIPPSVETS